MLQIITQIFSTLIKKSVRVIISIGVLLLPLPLMAREDTAVYSAEIMSTNLYNAHYLDYILMVFVGMLGIMGWALLLYYNRVNRTLREQYDSLVQSIPEILFRCQIDETWTMLYINNAIKAITGYPASDFINNNVRTFESIVHPDDQDYLNIDVFNVIDENNRYTMDYRIIDAYGNIKWLRETGKIITDENKKSIIEGIIIDITLQKDHEKSILQAKEIAEQANRAKSSFLANMSHEIRTPLNGVMGLNDLALSTELTTLQRDYLSKAKSASSALLGIINDILDYSKIEAGHIELEEITFNLETMIHELLDLFSYNAQSKNIVLSSHIDPLINNNLIGDPFRIKQALTNLLGNALKFTENGAVELFVSISEVKKDSISIRFSVKDTGIGMSKEQTEKLFNPFAQADVSNTRQYGGTGLGLAISQRLIKLMGGEIKIDSKPGKGSEFYFTIELGYKKQYNNALDVLKEKKALIICGNKISCEKIKEILKKYKIDIIHIISISQLSNIKSAESFDYAIFDMDRESIDDLEQFNDLYGNISKVRKIVLIPYIDRFLVNEVLSAKNNYEICLLHKPFTAISLLEAIMGKRNDICIEKSEKKVKRKSGKVLLVEDNEINRIVAAQNLKNYGLSVDIAQNGLEAVEMASAKKYDIIFMDLQMPVMDGYESARQIRKFDPLTPIIALSAAVMELDKVLAYEAGMNEHLAKPIEPDRLKSIIDRYLSEKKKDVSADNTKSHQADHHNIELLDANSLIKRLGGDSELASNLLINFIERYADEGKRLSQMDAASKEYDEYLHTLKGISGNLSMESLFDITSQMYGTKEKNRRDELLPKFVKILSESADAIEAYLEIQSCKEQSIAKDKDELTSLIDEAIEYCIDGSIIPAQSLKKLLGSLHHEVVHEVLQVEHALAQYDYEKAIEILKNIKQSCMYEKNK